MSDKEWRDERDENKRPDEVDNDLEQVEGTAEETPEGAAEEVTEETPERAVEDTTENATEDAPEDTTAEAAAGASLEDESEGVVPSAQDANDEPASPDAPNCDETSKGRGPSKRVLIALVAAGVLVVACILAYLFVHDWREATCTEPQTCSVCGITQGEPLGHQWGEATCTEPRTCSRCGEAEGNPLGHDWGEWEVEKEATCTEEGLRQRACGRCGETESEPVPVVDHKPGDWETVEEPTLDSNGSPVPGRRVRACAVCGAEVASEEINLSADEIESQFKKSCSSPSFDDVARGPDAYEGKRAQFTGEVIQVMQDGNTYTLRVNVTPVSYGYTDTIMVSYTAPEGSPRILEDDVLTFYGVMGGMYTYESIFGASITVPLLFAQYAE